MNSSKTDKNNKVGGITLAITKIGDLLLKNTITEDMDGKPVDAGKVCLKIPGYQRPYKWTAKNVSQLLDDILEAKNEKMDQYRLGTLILHKNKDASEQISYDIVDGQQRIITFALLLKYLDNPEPAILSIPIADNPFTRSNVYNNYRVIGRRINNMKSDIKDFNDYCQNNCRLIVLVTEDISEAFQFFDSQNARGKKLYPHDLLKAYHLREMNNMETTEVEKVVENWEDLNQEELRDLFGDYLYRIREWLKSKKAFMLSEQNIDLFKGIACQNSLPYAQFYKGAFAYANMVNNASIPFVSGMRQLPAFQLDAPIAAGHAFFDYTSHYFAILDNIMHDNKYEGYDICNSQLIRTLDLFYRGRSGDCIARLLLNAAILLYVDRFCPKNPSAADREMLDQFARLAFIWAFSLRAQYARLGWVSAQNFIMGTSGIKNSFNIFRKISEADSPMSLLSTLSDKLQILTKDDIQEKNAKEKNIDEKSDGVFLNYLQFFKGTYYE